MVSPNDNIYGVFDNIQGIVRERIRIDRCIAGKIVWGACVTDVMGCLSPIESDLFIHVRWLIWLTKVMIFRPRTTSSSNANTRKL